MIQNKYYIYIIRCSDGSLYTGITSNVDRRFKEHSTNKGAKYTKARGVERVEIVWETTSRSLAGKLEYAIKQLPKSQKEMLIDGSLDLSILSKTLDLTQYKKATKY